MPHYDLHAHTYHSDGTLSPADLVMRARSNGVDVLALTDHDVTDGIPEARSAAQTVGIVLVPGVEISVTWGAITVHVVGLGIDPECVPLQAGLAELRKFRAWRAEEMGRRLAHRGVPDAYAGARARAQGSLISRTHFAQFLVAEGHARDVRQVFRNFLVSGKPGHVPGQWAALSDAVGWIRAAGGQAVIAHPARYKLSAGRLQQLLVEFKEAGGEAIEVVSGSHSRDDYQRFARIAAQHNLLASTGSDYHGPEAPWIELGRLPPLPESCRPVWMAW
ncbi:MAG: PHP domain-containing protein [Acidiferrobacterales bacterium]